MGQLREQQPQIPTAKRDTSSTIMKTLSRAEQAAAAESQELTVQAPLP